MSYLQQSPPTNMPTIYWLGYEEFWEGKRIMDCPYPYNNLKQATRDAWLDGWKQAYKDFLISSKYSQEV